LAGVDCALIGLLRVEPRRILKRPKPRGLRERGGVISTSSLELLKRILLRKLLSLSCSRLLVLQLQAHELLIRNFPVPHLRIPLELQLRKLLCGAKRLSLLQLLLLSGLLSHVCSGLIGSVLPCSHL
jgi:hypothetical protein